MIVWCTHCGFSYLLQRCDNCPVCATPAPLWMRQIRTKWLTSVVMRRHGVSTIDSGTILRQALGGLCHIAEYPLLYTTSKLINAGGVMRDPIIDTMKWFNCGIDLPSSVSWQWTPTFEGASRLQFESHINDPLGSVQTLIQLKDVPLGYSFFSKMRDQALYFSSCSTNRKTGVFGCIRTQLHAKQRLGQGEGKPKWGQLDGSIVLSELNQPKYMGLDFSSMSVSMDFVDVRYMGSFMLPHSFYAAKNLVKHMTFKTKHDLRMLVKAEQIDLGVNIGPTSLSCSVGGEGDFNMILLDEPDTEEPDRRVVMRGVGDIQVKKFAGRKLPAWSIFRRKVQIVGVKDKHHRVHWQVKSVPKPVTKVELAPDKFQRFLEEYGPI